MKSAPLAAIAVSILAGCASNPYEPITFVDPDPVYRDRASQYSMPSQPEYDAEQQVLGRVSVVGGSPAQKTETHQPITDSYILTLMQQAEHARGYGDKLTMLQAYGQASSLGGAEADYELARIYLDSKDELFDTDLGLQHLSQAVERGSVEAQRVLARLYLTGMYVNQDIDAGHALMSAAAQSSARAQKEYGLYLCNAQKPHLNDCERGKEYLLQAAQASDGDAAYFIASSGLFDAESSSWAMKAAVNAGHPAAARMSVPQLMKTDPDQAGELLKRSALAGDTESIMAYANAVLLKKIPSIDSEREAYVWYSLAAKLGVDGAERELLVLDGARVAAEAADAGAIDREIEDLYVLVTGSGAR